MRPILAFLLLITTATALNAQMTFRTVGEYCAAMAEASTPTLLARVNGISKKEAIELMSGMTDPRSIRMVNEVIEFAYAKPANTSLDQMRAELRKLCLDRKIFSQ